MANEAAIYEQRQVSLHYGGLAAYTAYAKEQVWPDLNRQGARVLCLLNGLIGDPPEEVIQITRFPDLRLGAVANAPALQSKTGWS